MRICFVCLGNICRSPMAEFILKNKLLKLNLSKEIYVTSKATSYEEEGNDIHPKAKQKLIEMNIPIKKHRSTRLEKTEYTLYDYFICMEQSNINNALRIFETDPNKKLIRLLDLTNMSKDIADPWHTGDFDMTYKEIEIGINEFIKQYLKK